ncbi:hypothetical protein CEXT_593461 [Caerostris extrusa]|uniref:Uncharacterized protein n=1 Tax=Caerostris extrusa TaxID=172846 RepID=A0AAV4NVX3_CAEEX|nr:hypothetical protein CEXT_593461 [Caerostris extrusa]
MHARFVSGSECTLNDQFREFSSKQSHKFNDKKFSHGAPELTDDIKPEKLSEEFDNDDFDEELDDMSEPPFPDRETIHRKDTKDQVQFHKIPILQMKEMKNS